MLGKHSPCPCTVNTALCCSHLAAWLYGSCCSLQIVIHPYQQIWICWPLTHSSVLTGITCCLLLHLTWSSPILHLSIKCEFGQSVCLSSFCTSRILCKHLKQLHVKKQAARVGVLSAMILHSKVTCLALFSGKLKHAINAGLPCLCSLCVSRIHVGVQYTLCIDSHWAVFLIDRSGTHCRLLLL